MQVLHGASIASNGSSDKDRNPRCGLIVNPIAGMGGAVGLKGTDGAEILALALDRDARPRAEDRAGRALRRLRSGLPEFTLMTGAGQLGESAARAAELAPQIVYEQTAGNTTSASDTKRLAEELVNRQVDLVLVAGGDGTVCDVHSVTGDKVPLLGVPAGVKMHSALFARVPELAGDLAAYFLARRPGITLEPAEVMDIDEAAYRSGRLSARLHGYAQTPFERTAIQGPKATTTISEREALQDPAAEIAEQMEDDVLYLLGPGGSTKLVADALGLPSTLLGVDAVLAGRLVGRDLSERDILDLMAGRRTKAIVGVIGGQGCLFGRGNQQLSAEVIRNVGPENVIVLAGATKLANLSPTRLFVDTGDPQLDRDLSGYRPVRTGRGRQAMVRIDA